MPMNTAQARIIDPILTTVAQGYRHPQRVGSALFPRVPVGQRGGQVIAFGPESFLLYDAARAPGAATKRIDFGYSAQKFALEQHRLEGKVPVEHLEDARAVPGIDLGREAVETVMDALTLRLEYDQAQLARNPGNYPATHVVDLSAAKWSDPTNGDPTGDIEAGKEVVRGAVGLYPNTLVLSAQAFAAVKQHPKVVDRFKYTSRDSITAEMLAGLWDLERVVIGAAVYADDQGNFADVWGTHAVLAYAPRTPSSMRQPSYGYTYTLRGNPLVEEPYFERNERSWLYPVVFERQPVLTGMAAGYLLLNAV